MAGLYSDVIPVFKYAVTFAGTEAPDALLSNAQRAGELFDKPRIGVQQMMQWIATWIKTDGPLLGKPTHFQVRDGRF